MKNQDPKGQPFQVRGSMQTILSLRLLAPNDPEMFTQMRNKVAHAPDFFRDAPVILDVAPLAALPPIDLEAFCEKLRELRVNPIGLQHGSEDWNERAIAAGLAIFSSGSAPKSTGPSTGEQKRQPTEQPKVAKGASRIITQPIRGGQQIHADDGDLVVMAPVSDGAEIAAAGNIHIYSALRGRAFAGTNGDESAMIFCESLEAQLLSIAGIHMVSDEIDPMFHKKRVRVHCSGERLVIAPLP